MLAKNQGALLASDIEKDHMMPKAPPIRSSENHNAQFASAASNYDAPHELQLKRETTDETFVSLSHQNPSNTSLKPTRNSVTSNIDNPYTFEKKRGATDKMFASSSDRNPPFTSSTHPTTSVIPKLNDKHTFEQKREAKDNMCEPPSASSTPPSISTPPSTSTPNLKIGTGTYTHSHTPSRTTSEISLRRSARSQSQTPNYQTDASASEIPRLSLSQSSLNTPISMA